MPLSFIAGIAFILSLLFLFLDFLFYGLTFGQMEKSLFFTLSSVSINVLRLAVFYLIAILIVSAIKGKFGSGKKRK